MAVNIQNSELKETKGISLPSASLESLKQLRELQCSQSSSKEFKLQNYQRFLRRVLSPDSPVRNLLVVHGTGTGKTCTAIQVAEEYIIRPEFQDKPVLVLAQPSVQENFKNQIFNISAVQIDSGVIKSKQCTGRRYLDMILRVQTEPMKWTDPTTRERISDISQKLIKEFYEFQGYTEFVNNLDEHSNQGDLHLETWIHKTFDNRMIIVDEAHNLRSTDEGIKTKQRSVAIETVIKIANNVTLILLTATPMFDDYKEILYYFNLFLWNDRKQDKDLQSSKIFKGDGEFQEGMESQFRRWCQDYISFVRGDNPLTFPFRLPPPKEIIAKIATIDIYGETIPDNERRSVLTLTGSYVKGEQKTFLESETRKIGLTSREQTLCVFPKNLPFRKTFSLSAEENTIYKYSSNTPFFLSPSKVENYSSKFSLITKIIKESKGIIFVYSNLVDYGAQLFAMCLEEHGYISASGRSLLEKTSEEIEKGSKGKYALFTSTNVSESEQRRLLDRLRLPSNSDGSDIKIVVGSPMISEGIDLSYIRQIHILDFSWNMSGIEQAVGRGIRTCSHRNLPFDEQNCTVYLHVCKLKGSQELTDEYYYRTAVELKGRSISKIKNIIMESAMDCELQQELNNLPTDWKNLEITQKRSFKDEKVTMKLNDLASPIFEMSNKGCKLEKSDAKLHERPLSAYLDVRDEILDVLSIMFLRKPVWTKQDLLESPELENYEEDVVLYIIQGAIESGFKLEDRNGRIGKLESKGNMYAITFGKFNSLQDRYIKRDETKYISLRKNSETDMKSNTLEKLFMKTKFIGDISTRFSKEALEWYIVDHVMNSKDRLEHMLSLDWNNPPIYAKVLKTESLKILGSKKIYEKELIIPFGKLKDEYDEWVDSRMKNFLENRNKYFATMEENKILFNIDDKASVLKRVERQKNIGGRACKSYPQEILNLFVKWLSSDFPEYIKTNANRCMYLGLAVRQAIINGKEELFWITPEEWSIFDEKDNRQLLLQKFKV
jgi:superfamily II DNA or RNA helicase